MSTRTNPMWQKSLAIILTVVMLLIRPARHRYPGGGGLHAQKVS